jgi:hypothetical protein
VEGEGTCVGVGEGAHFGEGKGAWHVGEGESVCVHIGEGEAPAVVRASGCMLG